MKVYVLKVILLTGLIVISGCSEKQNIIKEKRLELTESEAINLSQLPLKCLQKEYPNKLNQTLMDENEMDGPSVLHPAFYGCFDWHSSVHGHWLLVNILRKHPAHPDKDLIIEKLKLNITKENIRSELAYFKRESEKTFERPYGWAWLLKLQEELDKWNAPAGKEMAADLQPLSDFIVQKYLDFLPRLNYPVRSGEHSNTAFGLSLAYDYAIHSSNKELQAILAQRSKDYYLQDKGCPINWEPGGYDFLSPCLQEAELMSKILSKEDFKKWFDAFLPDATRQNYLLSPATVSERTDGKLVHLDGANFCRAWSLFAIVDQIPEYGHLIKIANEHIKASLPSIADGSYEGEHWLATFALLALSKN